MHADDTPFYRRRGILAGVLAMAAIVAATSALGVWQLDRAKQKAALQAVRDRAQAQAPLLLSGGDSLPRTPQEAGALDARKIAVEGTFLPARAVFLDNRTRDGVAGFEVLMPIRPPGGDAVVLVMRGWVAGDPRDRNRVPTVSTPPGPQRVEGLAMAELPQPLVLAASDAPGPQDRIWQHFSFDRYAAWSGLAVAPVVVRQTVEPALADGLNRQWNQPGTGVDRHRAYAFQWFSMSALALGFGIVLVVRARRSGGDAG
ncbi:MAG: SURF1 family protein [Lautropia sp.]